ncbi:MAG TPA: hypothetical protein VMT64_09640, partial [Candidatus Binataceae bacterium]|nr:hypothetical protein [Candidatus Binataceae bacterium]
AFEQNNSVHQQLVKAAIRAQKVANAVELKSDFHFIRARQNIRKALAEDGIGATIEKLAEQALH